MKGKHEKNSGDKKPIRTKEIIIICSAILLIAILIFVLLLQNNGRSLLGTPTLTVETPQKISVKEVDTFTLDVTISDLGDVLYPAMSISLGFDSSRLEFLGVEEGNVFILDDESNTGVAQKLPDWSCNVEQSNETGLINIMYLDMTGGKYAFSNELLAEDDNVILRLQFRLRGSVRSGDILDLTVEDAVFAASDETQSLAMTTNTLKTRSGKLVVGD